MTQLRRHRGAVQQVPGAELGRPDIVGFWLAALLAVFLPFNVGTLAGATASGAIPDPSRIGLDVVFPAAMAGLAVGLIRARRELVAAGAGAGIAVIASLLFGFAVGIIAGGLVGPAVALVAGGSRASAAAHQPKPRQQQSPPAQDGP